MKPDFSSLDQLRDIVEPKAVSWWPLAPGWWAILAGLAVTVFFVALRTRRRWQANAYRRAALRELQNARSVSQVALILKRTALAAFPRTSIASLSGIAWCHWLDETVSEKMPPAVWKAISQDAFRQDKSDATQEVVPFAAYWIENHKTDCSVVESC